MDTSMDLSNSAGPTRSRTNMWMMLGSIVLVVIVVLGVLLWNSRPDKTLNAFLEAVEAGDQTKAMTYVSDTVKEGKRQNVEWFVEDWVSGDTIETEVEKTEAWRSKVLTEEKDGQEVPVLNKEGFEKRVITPLPRYFAHYYQTYATVTFDDLEDPVIIKLNRNTDETWSIFPQLFKGWKITQIKYQPLDEEDFVDLNEEGDDIIELDDDDLNLELEGEDGAGDATNGTDATDATDTSDATDGE